MGCEEGRPAAALLSSPPLYLGGEDVIIDYSVDASAEASDGASV